MSHARGVQSLTDNVPTRQRRDFVLISEFSELEGPLPLAVVADDIYVDFKEKSEALKELGLDEFDFNTLVLRIVSVDQTTSNFEQFDVVAQKERNASQEDQCVFTIPDDTQVYSSDADSQVYAFTHHLTLFDVNARGYVHPVALSYITSDSEKIVARFDQFMERLNEVARLLKSGNYVNFSLDLKYRLLDLEHTEAILQSNKKNKPQSLEAVRQSATATRLMIDVVEGYISQLNDSGESQQLRQQQQQQQQQCEHLSSSYQLQTNRPNTPESSSTQLSQETTKNDSITSSAVTTSLPSPPLAIFAQQEGHASKQSDNNVAEPESSYKPSFVDIEHPVAHFERRLRSVAQLCRNSRKGDAVDETHSAIPLVSTIEPKQTEDLLSKVTISKAVKDNLFTEAMQRLGRMTIEFGVNNEVLELMDDECALIEPLSSNVFIGEEFIANMENPQPRDILMNYDARNIMHADTAAGNSVSFISKRFTGTGHPWSSYTHHAQQKPSRYHINILKTLDQAFVHIVYSLLTGRPVIILGEADMQRSVQETVEALSLFVPARTNNIVTYQADIKSWFQEKVTEENLATTKLLGTLESNLDASIYKLDICCIKLTATSCSLLLSPLYLEGTWVGQIQQSLSVSLTDEAYAASVQSIYTDIALKSFIYYQLYLHKGQPLCEFSSFPGSRRISNADSDTTNSSASGRQVSRKWSVKRIMSYLRRIDESEHPPLVPEHPESVSGTDEESEDGNDSSDEGGGYLLGSPPPSIDNRRRRSSSSETADTSNQDGLSLSERRGRRFLENQLKVHGDDQSICIYLASMPCK